MKNNNSWKYILITILSGLTLAGCTSSNDEALNDIEQRVEIIDNTSELAFSGQDTETSNLEKEEVIDKVEEDVEEVQDEIEKIEEEAEEIIDEDQEESYVSTASYDGAVTADNVRIVGYNYYWENNQLVYEWTFKSGNIAKQIASYEAGFDENDNLVVEFASLTSDYVAVDGETVTLGSRLPDLTTSREGTISGYKFEIGSENSFEFTITGDKLILKLDI